jgi:hypothetical protein
VDFEEFRAIMRMCVGSRADTSADASGLFGRAAAAAAAGLDGGTAG